MSTLTGVLDAMLEQHGEEFTIRRETVAPGPNTWTPGVKTKTYTTVRGRERHEVMSTAKGTLQEGDKLLILNSAALPKDNDKIAPGVFTSDAGVVWRQIINPEAVRHRGMIAGWRIIMRK